MSHDLGTSETKTTLLPLNTDAVEISTRLIFIY